MSLALQVFLQRFVSIELFQKALGDLLSLLHVTATRSVRRRGSSYDLAYMGV